jgi:oligopeptidase B
LLSVGGNKLPVWDAERFSLLDRGFIYCIAHVRGDVTMGWKYYEEGKLLNKINSFNDLITCAKHLIQEGYTTSKKLAIYGRSAGGLLVTAAANMRPGTSNTHTHTHLYIFIYDMYE